MKQGSRSLHGERRNTALLLAVLFISLTVLLVGCLWKGSGLPSRSENAMLDLSTLSNYAAGSPSGPLSLEQAIQLAMEHNLEVAITRRERDIQAESVSAERRKMLLDLKLSIKDERVEDPRASSSRSINTGEESLEPSVSRERHTIQRDVDAVWDLLDFGLSYLRTKQASARLRMTEWQIRRVEQNLALDVCGAYSRAAIAQDAAARAGELLVRANERLDRLKKRLNRRELSDVDGLEYEKNLVQMQIRLHIFQRQLYEAKTELARLIGLSPGADFTVMPLPTGVIAEPVAEASEALDREALLQRPELHESDLKAYVADTEVRAAILKMFPNVNLFARREQDSNRFLYRNHWYTFGVDVAWNLLTLPQKLSQKRIAQRRATLEHERRLALAIGVLTQVRLSLIDREDAGTQQRLARHYDDIQHRLVEALRKRMKEGQASEDTVFAAEVDALFARVRHLSSCANVLLSAARLNNSLGRNPLHGLEGVKKPLVSPLRSVSSVPTPEPGGGEQRLRQTAAMAPKVQDWSVDSIMRHRYHDRYTPEEIASMTGIEVRAAGDSGGVWQFRITDEQQWQDFRIALIGGDTVRLPRNARIRFAHYGGNAGGATFSFSPWRVSMP